jgi:hypothetical protein
MSISPLGVVLPALSLGLGSILIKPKRGFYPGSSTNVVFKPLVAQITVEENHTDELEVTEHPVEQGAPIADHAYKRPSEVAIHMEWSNSPSPGNRSSTGLIGAAVGVLTTAGGAVGAAAGGIFQTAQSFLTGNAVGQATDVYKQLLSLQERRTLFDVFTGKRVYKDMLLRSINVTTNESSENSLRVTAVCRQIILVRTQTFNANINPEALQDPEETSPSVDRGVVNPEDATTLAPDAASVNGAMIQLNSTVTQASSMIDQVAGGITSLPGAVQGALNGIPEILTSVSDSISSVFSTLPISVNLPLIANPQSFSVTLETIGRGALGDLYGSLPAVLERAQSVISSSVVKLPGVDSLLPSNLSSLPTLLSGINTQITNTTKQIEQSLIRAPLP